MRNETRELFNQFLERQAELNGIRDAREQFVATPSIQQVLIDKRQESSAFLAGVNIVPVPEMIGEKIGLGISGTVTSNTDTSGGTRRSPTDPSTLDNIGYQCRKNNQDTALRYDKLDQWAKFPDFQVRIQRAISQRQALDTLMIGFNGTSYAATSNKVANPLLQDVNIGWLQHLRTDKPAQVMTAGTAVAGKVTYGPGGDYETLDALVYDAKHELLPTWARSDTGLVAICSDDLLHDKYFPLINKDEDPTEQIARDMIMSTKRLGGIQAGTPSYFPAKTILITRMDNLSIYEQEGKRRRMLKEEPELDRWVDYQSSNDAYVIEDYDYACMIENIEYAA